MKELIRRVNFGRREILLNYNPSETKLSELAGLLSRLGYAPKLNLEEGKTEKKVNHKDLAKIALAGFCCGNIMMMSFPAYFGLNVTESFGKLFAWLNLLLSIPLVLLFC